MRKNYNLEKMKMVSKGPLVDPKKAKVPVGIRLDADVLHWLMQEGERLGIGYQTVLTMKLRESMTSASLEERIAKLEGKRKAK